MQHLLQLICMQHRCYKYNTHFSHLLTGNPYKWCGQHGGLYLYKCRFKA